MNLSTRLWLTAGLWGTAVGWMFSVEVYRGQSRNHSNWPFWFDITAPLVSIALMLMALRIQFSGVVPLS